MIWRILAVIAFVGLGIGLWQVKVGKSRLEILGGENRFPVVSGYNLERQEFEFPRDFEGNINLVIVPFEQRQQLDVNTWLPAAQDVEAGFPGFAYYELPTIYELPMLSRTFINEGMRAGIPDATSRQRTITLYLDKDAFKSALGIETEAVIHLFLVDRQGNILWGETGNFSQEKLESLVQVIQDYKIGE